MNIPRPTRIFHPFSICRMRYFIQWEEFNWMWTSSGMEGFLCLPNALGCAVMAKCQQLHIHNSLISHRWHNSTMCIQQNEWLWTISPTMKQRSNEKWKKYMEIFAQLIFILLQREENQSVQQQWSSTSVDECHHWAEHVCNEHHIFVSVCWTSDEPA